ncbi:MULTISPECIES: N-acetylmuramoyl-L-alanine amidase [unclassified Streptomyces]|uniref:N-acetylmuramoyl-L-alanine amidase n=1 Tax=unclassified Streptomyces TaxID=2593676 RepID=UPI0006F774FB|nr:MULTISPECIES: N-acetylmuramoyl-L-alanine amidase [unclassified Streptomyces]KQX52411.1 N-acetylmuramoyl-L-alanine amidase [Streptomyces sp. Root1304]KRA87432.1 N-acetylmuramoyl-L-alanine amidase [Streptomyces sp. Root66D1]
MRASLASSIAVTCAAVLALPVSLVAPAAAVVPSALGLPPAVSAQPPAPELPGSTQSLPLAPLGGASRSLGDGTDSPGEQGLTRREVRPFSLVGVVWDDPKAALHGTVQVRTRAAGSGAWSEWQDVETHNEEHGADPDTAEGAGRALKGSTAPLWVGDSDGVEIRVRGEETLPEGLRLELVDPGESPGEDAAAGTESGAETGAETDTETGAETGAETIAAEDGTAASSTTADAPAPRTADAAPMSRTAGARSVTRAAAPSGPPSPIAQAAASAAEAAAGAVNAQLAPYGAAWIPALSKAETELTLPQLPMPMPQEAKASAAPEAQSAPAAQTAAAASKPFIGPRPKIITRKGWGADERIREKGFVYTKTIKAAFVHHSATGNNYTCRQAPSVLRSIYRYHVKSSGWRDFGYNFAVDKCGNIYEGRAGGVAKPVLGAHTLGFNTNSMGIAVLGTFSRSTPPAAAVTAVARLTAWKLGLYGVNPKGTSYLVSGGGNLYKKGTKVRFNAIAGHRDGFATECPGVRLYGKLGSARASSAKYQGRG